MSPCKCISFHLEFSLQEASLMTEDMHEERLQAVDALGESLVSLSSCCKNSFVGILLVTAL